MSDDDDKMWEKEIEDTNTRSHSQHPTDIQYVYAIIAACIIILVVLSIITAQQKIMISEKFISLCGSLKNLPTLHFKNYTNIENNKILCTFDNNKIAYILSEDKNAYVSNKEYIVCYKIFNLDENTGEYEYGGSTCD